MKQITIGQFLDFTNIYVPLYIEDEFNRYEPFEGRPQELRKFFMENDNGKYQVLDCPIDYIRNVPGGHFADDEKKPNSIILGIGFENWKKYFL